MLNMNDMKSSHRRFFCSGVFLLCLCSNAFAQDDFINSSGQQQVMKNEGHAEKKYVIKLETTQATKEYCHVSVDISYLQKSTNVIVDMTLENTDCAASGGSYTVAVKFRDGNSELQTVEYEETWQREDDQSLQSRQEYYMGENVDLINARVKRPMCVCVPIPTEVTDALPLTPDQ